LKEVSSIREQQALEELFHSASRGEHCAFGVEETMIGWDCRAIIRLYICRDLKIERIVKSDGEVTYCDEDEVVEDTVKRNGLLDWIIEHYREIGSELILVGSNTPEGAQLSKAFGGIAARLRIPIEMLKMDDDDPHEFDSDSDFDL
jgi:peptide subunit release factor 1 (eRF1)